jgi:hypothetical protein
MLRNYRGSCRRPQGGIASILINCPNPSCPSLQVRKSEGSRRFPHELSAQGNPKVRTRPGNGRAPKKQTHTMPKDLFQCAPTRLLPNISLSPCRPDISIHHLWISAHSKGFRSHILRCPRTKNIDGFPLARSCTGMNEAQQSKSGSGRVAASSSLAVLETRSNHRP